MKNYIRLLFPKNKFNNSMNNAKESNKLDKESQFTLKYYKTMPKEKMA